MGKKRQPSKKSSGETETPKASGPFNQALRASLMPLKAQMQAKAEEEARREREKEAAEAAKIRAQKAVRSLGASDRFWESGLSDEALFASAMAGVKPLEKDLRGHAPPPEPKPVHAFVRADAEAFADMCELIADNGPLEMTFEGEFVQGRARTSNSEIREKLDDLVQQLGNGFFSIDARLDLHGLTTSDARTQVANFIRKSRQQSKRCVLIVHGRGLNSKDHIPVLKDEICQWLDQFSIGRSVLAFCSARPQDGGTGALYVLLKKPMTEL